MVSRDLEDCSYNLSEFDPDDPHFPYGLCSYCNNIINRNPTQLPAPYDFSVLKFPVLTRSSGAQSPYLDDYKDCDCGICKVGRENAGTVGHQFGKKSLHNLGRPPLQGPRVDLGLPKSFKVCRDCRQPLARGKPHPCNVQNRRKQLEEQMRNDPVWAEISASKVIKAKASAQPGSDSIKLATGGTPLTLSNPSVRKPSTKARLPTMIALFLLNNFKSYKLKLVSVTTPSTNLLPLSGKILVGSLLKAISGFSSEKSLINLGTISHISTGQWTHTKNLRENPLAK